VVSGTFKKNSVGPNIAADSALWSVPIRVLAFMASKFFSNQQAVSKRIEAGHDADVHELERLEAIWNEAHEHGDPASTEMGRRGCSGWRANTTSKAL